MSAALGRAYIKKICEVLGIDPQQTSEVIVHFDPREFVWAEIKMLVPPEATDRVVKLFEDAKNGVPIG